MQNRFPLTRSAVNNVLMLMSCVLAGVIAGAAVAERDSEKGESKMKKALGIIFVVALFATPALLCDNTDIEAHQWPHIGRQCADKYGN